MKRPSEAIRHKIVLPYESLSVQLTSFLEIYNIIKFRRNKYVFQSQFVTKLLSVYEKKQKQKKQRVFLLKIETN